MSVPIEKSACLSDKFQKLGRGKTPEVNAVEIRLNLQEAIDLFVRDRAYSVPVREPRCHIRVGIVLILRWIAAQAQGLGAGYFIEGGGGFGGCRLRGGRITHRHSF